MSRELEDYHLARRKLVLAAVEMLAAEMRLGDAAADALAVTEADASLAFAARSFTESIDALPRERQPKGWGETA